MDEKSFAALIEKAAQTNAEVLALRFALFSICDALAPDAVRTAFQSYVAYQDEAQKTMETARLPEPDQKRVRQALDRVAEHMRPT